MALNLETTIYSGYSPSQKPKPKPWGKILTAIFWLAVLLGAIYFFFFSNYFKIKDIIVEGTNKISSEQIKNDVQKMVEQQDNLFLFDKGKAVRDLSNIAGIKTVEIYRGVPNALKVKITEREEKLIWKTGDERFLLDSDGTAFEKAPDDSTLPVVEDKKANKVEKGRIVVSTEFINFVTELIKNLESKTQLKIISLYVPESTYELYLATDAGFTIYFDTMGDPAYQVDALVKVLPQLSGKNIEYVDLRTPNWLYYK